jgi:hypothetical protein
MLERKERKPQQQRINLFQLHNRYAGMAGPIKTIVPTVPTTQQMVTAVSKKICLSSQSVLNCVGNNSKTLSFSCTFSGRNDGEKNQDF